jgi:serine/threonine protein kinase/CHASE1-domain containing sensor protein
VNERPETQRRSSEIDPAMLGRTVKGLPWRMHFGGVAIFAFGMLLALSLFLVLRGRASDVRRAEFERQANQVAAAFRGRLDLPLEVLHSISSLFDASNEVTRDEFHAFVSNALNRHPGIRALEWIPIVQGPEREAYVNRARADGLKGFDFKQVGPDLKLIVADARPEYLPILYMEPPDALALGFDVASDATRRAPVDRARERDAPVVSERIRLVEDPPTVASVAVFLPVHVKGMANARVMGFATAVFRVHQVVEPVIKEAFTRQVQMVVTDPAASAQARLLFETEPGLFAALSASRRVEHETQFPYVDRTWKMSFASASPGPTPSDAPWMVLGVGFVVSALLALAYSALKVIYALHQQVRDALRLGQYTLIEKLGEGGMGVVYRGKHALLRRPTAIKLLPPTRRNAHQLARFEREVQMTSRLAHPNTISIYDYGRTPEGIFYYAMEYLDGITLEDLVAAEGPLPAGRVIRILEQVAGALAEAHDLGLIHRDIKPANIMLTRRGGIADFVKVLDFGLVKESENASDNAPSLSRGVPLLGTPLYLAPEAITSGELDARADLYALGAVAYYLVCGATVFEGASVVEVCLHHLNSTPVAPSQRGGHPVPARLEALILQCLAKKPDDRPQSAAQLLVRLRELEKEIEPFSEKQANAFWDERWPAIAERIDLRQRSDLSSSAPNTTIAVDPRERDANHEIFDAPRSRRMGG